MTVTFTVGFLSALLTPIVCTYEKVAKLGRYFGRCMLYVSGVANLSGGYFPSDKGGFLDCHYTVGISDSSNHTSFVYNYVCIIDQASAKLKSSR